MLRHVQRVQGADPVDVKIVNARPRPMQHWREREEQACNGRQPPILGP
jgi:hypothetical protein